MIRFYHNLYVSDSIKKLKRVKWKILTGRGQLDIYLITICNAKDQLEIIHNSLLKQKAFRKSDLRVVGITSGYGDAFKIVQNILDEVLDNTGTADMKKYLLEHF